MMVDQKYQPYGLQQQVQRGDANLDVMIGNYDQKVALDKQTIIGKDNLEDVGKDRIRTVAGEEKVDIQGIQTIKAAKIFLN